MISCKAVTHCKHVTGKRAIIDIHASAGRSPRSMPPSQSRQVDFSVRLLADGEVCWADSCKGAGDCTMSEVWVNIAAFLSLDEKCLWLATCNGKYLEKLQKLEALMQDGGFEIKFELPAMGPYLVSSTPADCA